MENYKKKDINILISIFIILSPILDVLTGLNVHYLSIPLTMGMVIRMLFLFILFLIVLFYYHKSKVIILYLIVGIFMIFHLLGNNVFKTNPSNWQEIQNIIKTFYFPLLLGTIYSIKEDIRISNLTLFKLLFLYLIFIFVPLLLGIGYQSYRVTKAGTLGFYNSANEISGIISILTPVMFIILKTSKKIIPKLILMIMYLTTILMMGTKTPLLTLCLITGATLLYFWIKWLKQKEIKKIVFSIIVVLFSIIGLDIILPKTNFYKNIETHLDFLGVDNVFEVFTDKKLMDHFIFSQRITFLHKKANIFHSANRYQKFFGIGIYQNGIETKSIEMDYFDIYYNYGLIGFFVFFGIVLSILYQILVEEEEISFKRYMTRISLLLIILLSLLTGHILTAPSVSIIVCIIVLSLNDQRKKRIFITGKELVEKDDYLIENLNQNNINSTIILEDKIPKNKISFLFFKIINYDNYDISFYLHNKEELGKELVEFTSSKKGIVVNRMKQEYENYDWIICREKRKIHLKKILYYDDKSILKKMEIT